MKLLPQQRHSPNRLNSKRPNKVSILHLPTDVGGNPQEISKQMRALGLNSNTLVLQESYFNYGADTVVYGNTDKALVKLLKRLKAFAYVFKYDVVFFNFGTSLYSPAFYISLDSKLKKRIHRVYNLIQLFLQRLELFVLKARRCVLLVQYQGDDARQGQVMRLTYNYSHITEIESSYYTKERDKLKRSQIELFASVCGKIYFLNPDLAKLLPDSAEFLPYSHIDLNQWIADFNPRTKSKLRIAHAPTHRGVKGTRHVLRAIEKLIGEGAPIELCLIEGLSNAKARKQYETCDLLIDQLFIGWYGGLAVEFMALGKPVICYIREEDLGNIPGEMAAQIPVINARANTLSSAICSALEMSDENWAKLQLKSRKYVERWHDSRTITEKICRDVGIL